MITQENKTLSHEEDAKSLGGDAEWFRRLFIQKDSEIELLKQEIAGMQKALYDSYKRIRELNKAVSYTHLMLPTNREV